MGSKITRRVFLKAVASGGALLLSEGLPGGNILHQAAGTEPAGSGDKFFQERQWAGLDESTTPRKEKDDLSEREDRIQQIYDSGFNCAESVLKACQELYRLPGADVVPKAASGFGGGIGRKGSVCGALSGGILALGLAMGRMDPKDAAARDRIYAKARELYERFEREFGTVLCANLTQCDLGTPEGQKKFKDLGLHKNLCSKFVQGVTLWVGEMIEEKPGI